MAEFVKSYRSLYRALNSPEATIEDFERWAHIVKTATSALETLLQNENLTRNIKYSYETSLGHFITIQLQLDKVLKSGGAIQQQQQQQQLSSVSRQQQELEEDERSEEDKEGEEEEKTPSVKWSEIDSAFKNRIKTGLITNLGHKDFDHFMDDAKVLFKEKMKKFLQEFEAIKVNTALTGKYMVQKADLEDIDVKQFNTKNVCIYKTSNLDQIFENDIRKVLDEEMEDFQEAGSGWSLLSLLHLTININKLNPMRAGCAIKLPEPIQNRKACINVQNNDKQCFKWSVLASLYLNFKNPQNVTHYKKFEGTLNFDGIDFPVQPKDIPKFERQNDISVNVYMLKRYDDKYRVSPLHVTSNKQERHVNLLLVEEFYHDENSGYNEKDDSAEYKIPQFHYVTIKSMSRLVGAQLNRDGKKKCYVCDRCLHYFYSEDKLKVHELDCALLNNDCKLEFPSWKNRIVKFKNYNRKELVPVVVYADFECLIKPREDGQVERVVSNHQAFSIGYYVKYSYDFENTTSEYKTYRQLDESMQTPAEWFIEEMKVIVARMEEIYENIKPMELTRQQQEEFEKAKKCHICGDSFSKEDKKVRDHCHLTGR